MPKAKAETPAPKNDPAPARAKKAANVRAKQDAIAERVQEILANPSISGELKRKLAYTQEAVEGKWPGSDVGLMAEVRARLIQDAAKRRW